jgi:hypothetical protein
VALETNLEYRRAVHEVIDTEPRIGGWEVMYGELVALGIVKGNPSPDDLLGARSFRRFVLG